MVENENGRELPSRCQTAGLCIKQPSYRIMLDHLYSEQKAFFGHFQNTLCVMSPSEASSHAMFYWLVAVTKEGHGEGVGHRPVFSCG